MHLFKIYSYIIPLNFRESPRQYMVIEETNTKILSWNMKY